MTNEELQRQNEAMRAALAAYDNLVATLNTYQLTKDLPGPVADALRQACLAGIVAHAAIGDKPPSACM